MPFRTRGRLKTVYWTKPSEEEVQLNQSRIRADQEDQGGVVMNLPASLQEQIAETLEGGRNVATEVTKLMEAGPVDIIVPVHNGLHVVKKCLESVIKHTKYPYHLIIVDDASDEHTSKWLDDWMNGPPVENAKGFSLLRNNKNRGFCSTCNRGVDHGDNPFVVLLNSDTIVTEGWLSKMVRACLADPRNAIINPATNNTALIDVPMRPGFNYQQMNKMLEMRPPKYPIIMPTGFCFFVRREVWNQIGGLDEGFTSYGEESDFWMRALKCIDPDTGEFPQYRSVLADDTYIFHERGASFSVNDPDEWMKMRKIGSNRFKMLHPDFFRVWQMEEDTLARLKTLKTSEIAGLRKSNATTSRYNITWLVCSTAYCGGMKVIADIVNELNEQGVNASVCLISREGQEAPTPLPDLRTAPYVFTSKEDCINRFSNDVFDRGIVTSGTGELGDLTLRLCQENKALVPLNHLQSWDVGHIEGAPAMVEQLKTIYKAMPYTITNAAWLSDTLRNEVGVEGEIQTVTPGVDMEMFYPGDRSKGDERLTFAFILCPKYPFKGSTRGVQVAMELEKIARKKKISIKLIGVGIHSAQNFPKLIGVGQLAPTRWSKMLREEVDVLVDPSHLHTYGLPGAEAVCSNVKFAGWENRGIREYAEETRDLIFPDTFTPLDCAMKLFEFAETHQDKNTSHYLPSRKTQVTEFITTLEDMMNLHSKEDTKVCIITPHVRKFGGPTTLITTANLLAARGYDVSICSVYSDSIALELTEMCKVPLVFGIEMMPECDVVLVPSDSDMHDKILEMGRFKKRILYKLSHNERFKILEERGLQHDYDKILTSTEWLKEACEKTVTGWNYPPREATRIGWYNYSFPTFKCSPNSRIYHKYKGAAVVIAGLVHKHPLKGTNDFMTFCQTMHERHGKLIKIIGIGETEAHNHLSWFDYYLSPSRTQMADLFKQVDIWMNFSHTEGLGRLPLEAMSAGCAVVASDTGCEFMHHEGNGLVFPIGDVKEAIKEVEKLFANEKLLTHIVNEGYQTALAYSDPTPYVAQMDLAIEEVLSGQR